MHIEKYEKDKHLDVLQSWLAGRNIPIETAENLPEIGIVAYNNETPIAMAFLRQVEGDIGLFDGLCSNPKTMSDLRNDAIDLLVLHLIDIAKEFKMRSIIAWSLDNNTLLRSVRHGFQKQQSTLIKLDLFDSSTVH